jgi:hypothetical protein
MEVRSQPGQIVRGTLSRKTLHKNRAGGVAQGEGPEFKPQYLKNIFHCTNPYLKRKFHIKFGISLVCQKSESSKMQTPRLI